MRAPDEVPAYSGGYNRTITYQRIRTREDEYIEVGPRIRHAKTYTCDPPEPVGFMEMLKPDYATHFPAPIGPHVWNPFRVAHTLWVSERREMNPDTLELRDYGHSVVYLYYLWSDRSNVADALKDYQENPTVVDADRPSTFESRRVSIEGEVTHG